MELLQDDSLDYDPKQVSFETLIAMRELLNIAINSPAKFTYKQSFNQIHDLSPETYDNISKHINPSNLSEIAKYYIELAEGKSLPGKPVDPIDLIDDEISGVQSALDNAGGNKKRLQARIRELHGAKKSIQPRKLTENKMLNRDFFLANSRFDGLLGEKLYSTEDTADYRLPNDHYLRIRLTHPENSEKVLGVDLIYEVYDLENEKVRFVQLQYKKWNEVAFYLQDKRMNEQINKMKKNLCNAHLCFGDDGATKNPSHYRLPYCCGFLRPTTELQPSNKEVSTIGWHLPICEINNLMGQKKITLSNIKGRSLDTRSFEDLFRLEMVGSRWVSIDTLYEFYKKVNLFDVADSVRFHAQEVSKNKTESKEGE